MRVRLIAFLAAVLAALVVAASGRDTRGAADSKIPPTNSQAAAVYSSAPRPTAAFSGELTRRSELRPDEAGGAALSQSALAGRAAPLGQDEITRRHEERRKRHAAQRAAWEEHGRQNRANARARALEHAKGDPELVERLQAQHARQDERDRLRKEHRQQSTQEHAERAARIRALGHAVPRASDAPVIGPPVIGPDGVAYNPRKRAQ